MFYSLLKSIAKIIATFAVILGLYLVYYWFDMTRLRAFCDALKPGTPIAELTKIGEQHGISPGWLQGDGAFNVYTQQWNHYVPSTASAGANVCAIHHNKAVIISAEIQID